MKLGFFTVMMANEPLEKVLDLAVSHRMQAVELGTGGWVGKTHCSPEALLADPAKVRHLQRLVGDRQLEISALSCHGNPLHPRAEVGHAHAEDIRSSIRLAERLGVTRIVGFSGCPAGNATDTTPNWVHEPWPDDFPAILKWQWSERLVPFWRETAALARQHGVKHLCFELHPADMLYNAEALFKLRDAVGEEICCNYDMSNIEWQGVDTLAVIGRLGGDVIKHVHMKDARIYPRNAAVNGTLDAKPYSDEANRSWNFRTVGWGHGPDYWTEFLIQLRMIGYDGVLSIEHEDSLMSAREGLEKAVTFLHGILLKEPPGPMTWA
jgi:sugar phosphate isomerase/epimerase